MAGGLGRITWTENCRCKSRATWAMPCFCCSQMGAKMPDACRLPIPLITTDGGSSSDLPLVPPRHGCAAPRHDHLLVCPNCVTILAETCVRSWSSLSIYGTMYLGVRNAR